MKPHALSRAPRDDSRADDGDCSLPMSGPHAALDRYGRLDHYYWRCAACGLETTAPAYDERESNPVPRCPDRA